VNFIPHIVSYITRHEGDKFLRLIPDEGDAVVNGIPSNNRDCALLYVHIPFCRSLCPFCCFNRYLYGEDMARRYYLDLKQELDLYIRQGFNFSSVYFGGGTPTILMDELLSFIDYLRERFDIHEVSLENYSFGFNRREYCFFEDCGDKPSFHWCAELR
jgi:coproporphyrinogen III oxidase-like Fe-S oxidoreductase